MSDKIEQIGDLILEVVSDRFDKEPLDLQGFEFGDSFAELIEKFIILHIRIWKFEDAVADAKSYEDLAELKIKLDYCFKEKRPKLIKAINSFLDVYISKNHARLLSEENTKLYKGYKT